MTASDLARAAAASQRRATVVMGSMAAAATYDGLCWPKGDQRRLLECLFLPDEARARDAFAAWRGRVSLDLLEGGSLALMPLLYYRLRALGVADPALARLKGAHRYHWCRGEVLRRRALEAVDALAAAGIRPLALKGLAMVEHYGGDHGLRPMSDVDLLVPRAQGAAAVAALARRGWRPGPALAGDALGDALEHLHGGALVLGGAELDLHWASLVEDLSPDGDAGLWRRARARTVEGRALSFPTVTDLLFHVCVHGARFSRAGSVIWVPDAMRLLDGAGGAVDWPGLIQQAAARHLQLPLREALRFLREVLGASVPADVVAALEPPEPKWLYWYDHHAFAADPAASAVMHRAAARILAKIRRGETVTGLTVDGAGR
jgi:hypothetical protein